MKKLALLLSLTGILSLSGLTSCNQNESNTGTKPTLNSDFDTNISAEITFAVQDGTASWFSDYVTAFNSVFPNIKVNVENSGNYASIDESIRSGLASGSIAYNMALTYPDYVASYLSGTTAKYVLNIDDYMDNSVWGFGHNDPEITWNGEKVQLNSDKDDMIQSYLDQGAVFSQEGHYVMPFSKSTEMLFVNKNMLTEAATTLGTTYDALKAKMATWEGLWEVVDQLKQAMPDKFNGKPAKENNTAAPLVYEDEANFYITLCQQLGIPYVDSSKTDMPVLFGKEGEGLEKTVDLMKFLDEKYNAGCFVSEGTSGTSDDYYATATFADQQAGMIITTTAGLSWLNNYTGPFFDIDVLPMPSSETDWVHGGAALPATAKKDAVISQGPGIVMLNSGDETENLATWLFYKTMTSDFLNAQWVNAGTYAPVRSSVYDTDTFEHMFDVPEKDSYVPGDGDPEWEFLAGQGPAKRQMYNVIQSYDEKGSYYTTDVFPGSGSVRNEAGKLISACVNSANNTDETAISDLVKEYYRQAIQSIA